MHTPRIAARPIRLGVALLATLILGACASVGPNYAPPAVTAPATWSRADASTQTDHLEANLSRWWERLDDSLLSSLIDEALRASPDLRLAQAKLREARAQRRVAGADRFPSLNASASASVAKSGSAATDKLYSAGFDASWEPDVFGGTRRALEAAGAVVQASEASLHDTQVSLTAEVALNYIELRAAQTRLTIARDNLASQSETLQLTDWRAQAGLVSSLDVEQARANQQQTRASVPSLETTRAQAEHRLAILLGLAPGTLHDRLDASAPIPSLPETIAIGIPADTLRQRPDVRAAERTLAAETARIGVATADLYPSFSLSGSIGVDALTPGGLWNGTVTRSLLGSVAANLFDAGRIRGKIAIQTAVQEQALASYESTVLTALEDVENALVSLANSRERRAALLNAADAARTAALLARHQYASGLIDFQTVLDTERSVLTLEDSLASTEADGMTALIQLYKAMGGGWSPETPAAASARNTDTRS